MKLIFPRKRMVFAVMATVSLGLCAPWAWAQSSSTKQRPRTTVVGTVRDVQGAVVLGVTLRLEGKDGPELAEVNSGADGNYSFLDVAPGKYTVTAKKMGWRTATSGALVLSDGETKQLDLVLEPAPGVMEFDDKPNFSVAGVTDWNNTGIHGSDSNQRTSEALVKETLALKSGKGEAIAGSAEANGSERELQKERERLKRSFGTTETAEDHRKLGEVDEQLGELLEAAGEFERAAVMSPSEQNYFAWGTELLLHRADQPAVEVFTKGARLHPRSARMLAGLGAALYAGGNAEEAARKLCEAADLSPRDPVAYLFLGRIEKATPAVLPCSEEKLARFVKEQPGNAMADYYYGIVLWKRDRGAEKSVGVQQAEALLEKATAIDSKFGEAYLQLGILHFGQAKFEQAIRDYKKAIEASPQLSEPHYRLGLAYRRIEDETKADQEFRIYEEMTKAETAALEKERKELRQFLIILKDQPATKPQ